MADDNSGKREIVLVGAGHAHIQIFTSFAEEPPETDYNITLIADTAVAMYSGMVPGFVAGQYTQTELEIDVRPLAKLINAKVIVDKAVGIDPDKKTIELEKGEPVSYDLLSLDVGSTVVGLDVPGVREHSLPTRPIGKFAERVIEIVHRAGQHTEDRPFQLIVVGGGAGGVELAFAFDFRLKKDCNIPIQVKLLEGGSRILKNYPKTLLKRVYRRAAERGIEIQTECRVTSASSDHITLDDGSDIPSDALVWVTGPICQPIFRKSNLAIDDRDFLRIRSTLQSEGHDDIFAVGDCATLIDYPTTPKAGVYAVREGPFITNNLRAALTGQPLKEYVPQHEFLMLMNLGNGSAIGIMRGWTFEGKWVMKLKDSIDRKFMRKFQME